MKMTRLLAAGALTAALTTAAVALPAVPAQAAALGCGSTITADVRLTRDLTCAGTALVVAVDAPGTVQVDLGGHRVRGNGSGIGIEVRAATEFGTPGALAVRNGTVTGFAVALVGSSHIIWQAGELSLDRVTLRGNGAWVPSGAVYGQVAVTRSRIVDSGAGGAGIEGDLVVRASTFQRSAIDSQSESYNHLYDSVFTDTAFRHGWAANVVATGNTFRGCDIAIDVPDVWPFSPTTIEGYTFDSCRIGLQLRSDSGGATVRGNTFTGNTEDGFTFQVAPHVTLTVTGNRFVRNGGDGISGTGGPGVTITGNTAIGNGGHGIDVAGVSDGGGNVARHNRTAPQCVGVACSG